MVVVNMAFSSAGLMVGVDDLRHLFQQYQFHDPTGYSCERWERKLNMFLSLRDTQQKLLPGRS